MMIKWWKKFSNWFGDMLYHDELRYMVRATGADGKEFVVGWSTLRSGGTPMRLVKEHPVWHSPIVIDTKEGVLGKGPQKEWDDGHGDSWPPTY